MKLFGSVSDRKKNFNLCHQDLLEKKGALTRFEDLPMGSFVMFVSHQWNSFDHPDPNGVQIETLVNVIRKLRDGEIDRVDMDQFHTILYEQSETTTASEFSQLLSNAYIW